jgi:hypothetical protein
VISFRFVPIVCAMLLLALVPTWIHSYSGAAHADGLTTSGIPAALGAYHGLPTARNATWGKRRFDSDDWFERTYTDGSHQVRLTVVRSNDLKTLYHHPELAVAYGPSFLPETLHPLPGRPEIPVHVLSPAEGGNVAALYVLQYEQRFVADPIPFQIRTAGELLFTRRQPMTLFFATETVATDVTDVERLSSPAVLQAAIDAFAAEGPATHKEIP